MKEAKKILPKGFFEIPRETITSKEALKDVVPIDWDEMVVKEDVSKYNKKAQKKKTTKKAEEFIEEEQILMDLEYELIKCMVDTRKKEHLTQQEIADKIHVFREAIARIETNKVSPQLGTIIKILYSMGYKLEIVPVKEINN